MHRALLEAGPATGAAVVIKAVAVSRSELDHGVLRARPQTPIALAAVAAGQATACLEGRVRRGKAADHLREIAEPLGRFQLGLLPAQCVTEIPQVQHLERGRRVLGRALELVASQPGIDLPGGALAVSHPTVTVRSAGTMSPPANTPGHPVISELDTRTVPSGSNSTPGTARRNVVSVSWPSARITVSASSVSNRPVGCGNPDSSSSMTSTCSCSPSKALIVRRPFIRAHPPPGPARIHRRVPPAVARDATPDHRAFPRRPPP